MSCAPNLCIRKIVKRRQLEKKENEKTHLVARHIGFAPSRAITDSPPRSHV
jgi:hypothetical protein